MTNKTGNARCDRRRRRKSSLGVLAAALLAAVAPWSGDGARAETCGVGDAPCAAEGGVYHIETPDGAAQPPAILFLHGWGGSGEGQMKSRGLVEAWLNRGYAVVAPTGQPRGQGRGGARWASYGDHPLMEGLRDDVAFLRRVADDAASRFDLDRDRMTLGGFSGGGMMTWRVACEAPESFAAYLPVAGLLWRPLPEDCAGPVRLLHTHGWSDTVVPIEGRSVAGGRLTQGDLFVGLDLLRRANGCAKDDPDAYDLDAGDGRVWRRRWSDCAAGTALEFALHPGGHSFPPRWSTMALDWLEGLTPAE